MICRTGVRVNGDLVRILYLYDLSVDKSTGDLAAPRLGEVAHEVRRRGSTIKFGCTVSKRFAKAHQRNRGRRIMREAFRQLTRNYKIIPNLKIILSMREKGLQSKTQDIYRELEKLFRRKKLLST